MKAPRFAKFFAQLPLLNQPQRLQVLDALHPGAGLDRSIALIGEIRSGGAAVPAATANTGTGTAAPTTCNVFAAAPVAARSTTWLPKLDPQALLVTDANAAYRRFVRDHGIAHQAVNLQAGARVRASAQGAIHVQNVNAYHRRFKEWLARFHGVSSCRVPNYLGWHWALDGGRIASVEQLLCIAFGFIHIQR